MNFASSGLFFTQKSVSIGLKWIQWITNRSPSAKNQFSKIRLSENANKKIPQFLLHCRWLYLTQIPQISQIFL